MNIQSCYRALNADWQGALRRFGSPDEVRRFLNCFREDESLKQLNMALERHDGMAAYRAAHTLKGVAGMLGLTQLTELAEEMCAELRVGRKPPGRLRQALEQCQERVMAYIAVLPVPMAVLQGEELTVLKRCFAGMPEDVRVVEAETGRSIYEHGEPLEAPERLVWDAAWLKRSGQQGMTAVWHYAPGYAVIRREKAGQEDVLSMVSHDIRTPLHVITGMAAAARECRADTARLRLCLDRIDLAGMHLKSLVSSVLDHKGQMTLCPEEFALPELLQRVVTLLQPESAARQQTLKLCLGEIRHERVRADRNRLARIILNLMTNAIKYTGPGGSIELYCCENSSGRYTLTVQDSGAGMTESFVHRAFKPYVRAVNTQEDGQGLGLAIVQRLVEMMDGEVEVRSCRGMGTAVHVCLPLQPVEELPRLQGLRVLLAEDHPLCAQATALMLEQAGMPVLVVHSACEAMNCTAQFDCAIMDLHLQDADGCQVGKIIRHRHGTPVLVLSGDGSEAVRRSVAAAGLQGLLVKPVDQEQLIYAIGRAMTSVESGALRRVSP